jgi:hypothetical protein
MLGAKRPKMVKVAAEVANAAGPSDFKSFC